MNPEPVKSIFLVLRMFQINSFAKDIFCLVSHKIWKCSCRFYLETDGIVVRIPQHSFGYRTSLSLEREYCGGTVECGNSGKIIMTPVGLVSEHPLGSRSRRFASHSGSDIVPHFHNTLVFRLCYFRFVKTFLSRKINHYLVQYPTKITFHNFQVLKFLCSVHVASK